MHKGTNRPLLMIMLFYGVAALIAVPLCGSLSDALSGLRAICLSPSQLTIDYFLVGGLGGTFLNTALVSFACAAVYGLSGTALCGASFIAFFLAVCFTFFGTNILNMWPCMLGTMLFARLTGRKFGEIANIGLLTIAASPIISEMLLRYPPLDAAPFLRIPAALLLGLCIGMTTPILFPKITLLHRGNSLYNGGPSACFVVILLVALFYRAAGVDIPTNTQIGPSHPLAASLFVLATAAGTLFAGFMLNGRSLKGYATRVLRQSGYQCDLFASAGLGLTLINIGLFTLLMLLYYTLIDAPMTGPTVGCVFGALACTCVGGHPRTMIPLMLGYILAGALAPSFSVNTQAIAVGICFCAAITPFCGRYGALIGVLAAAAHACMVTTVVTFHSGFCLFNGGFTALTVLMLMLPICEFFFEPSDTPRLLPLLKEKF